MNIRQLECFREILVTGTVTGAAKVLGISQPSASGLIANLERELGFALFKRARGRLEPTPEAQYLSSDVQQTLDSIELTTQRAKQIRDQRVGSLVVATYPDIAIDFLPKVISQFREDRPDLQVTILARRSEMMRGLLPTHLYDLAIVESPTEHPSVEMEEFNFNCVCALSENHPLAGLGEITPADLDGLPFISLLPEHDIYSQIERAFADCNAALNVVVETQTMESVSGFLRHDAGVGLLDPLTAKRYAGQGLVVRPFVPSITQKIALVLPRDRLRSAILEEFIAVLRLALASA
jgi:DNA-binding transcriptional LysR family regulator